MIIVRIYKKDLKKVIVFYDMIFAMFCNQNMNQ